MNTITCRLSAYTALLGLLFSLICLHKLSVNMGRTAPGKDARTASGKDARTASERDARTASTRSKPRHRVKSSDNCTQLIVETLDLLEAAGVKASCSSLVKEGCEETYQQLRDLAHPQSVLERSATCTALDMPSNTGPVSDKELKFPLAFLITAYTDARNLEAQLSQIFQPQNSYCLHVDPKADPLFLRTVQQIIQCYRKAYPGAQIFLSSTSVPIYWGHFSIQEADLICMKDLLEADQKWQYALNIVGSELVRVDNRQLVDQLSSTVEPEVYIQSCPMRGMAEFGRVNMTYELDLKGVEMFNPDKVAEIRVGNWMKYNPNAHVPPVPFGMTVFKGSKTFRLPRRTVDFIINHEVARVFIDWSKKQISPEEQIIPTLARISSVEKTAEGWLVHQNYTPQPPCDQNLWLQLALWKHKAETGQKHRAGAATCFGRWRNNVCVFSIRDLPYILSHEGDVVNKFRTDIDPYITQCIIEMRGQQLNLI